MTLLRASLLGCGVIILACAAPTAPHSPVVAQLELAAPSIAIGDSVGFTVIWTNQSSHRIELTYPIAHDVRLTGPDGRTEFLHTGQPALGILTPDLIVDGGSSRRWTGYWRANQRRGTYTVEAGRIGGDGRFVPLGARRTFSVD
ncbi:MAG: hypothetical protein IT359_10785 [Gemmatimonadaceae bacterium]|nr:hypothetical protein [Gemmatimonadaceae bacterium]